MGAQNTSSPSKSFRMGDCSPNIIFWKKILRHKKISDGLELGGEKIERFR